MIPEIKITKSLLNKITSVKEPLLGKLHGILYQNTIYVLSGQVDLLNEGTLQFSLPNEVDCFGLFCTDTDIKSAEIINKIKRNSNDFIDVTDNPVFIYYNFESNNITAYLFINEKLEEKQLTTITDEDIYKEFLYVRLKGNFTINSFMTKEACIGEITKLENIATSGKLGFNISKTSIFLLGNDGNLDSKLTGVDVELNIGDIFANINKTNEFSKIKYDPYNISVLDVNIYLKTTQSSENDHSVCMFIKQHKNTASIPINFDTLAIINVSTTLNMLYEVLVGSVVKSLAHFERALLANLPEDGDEGVKIALPEVFHVFPAESGHFLSIWANKNADQTKAEQSRRQLHRAFLLPLTRPLFKRENRYIFRSTPLNKEPLINIHENVKPTNNGGIISLVKGRYSYYHYCQNNMDDAGWGCAYRSLQTLASWFKWQGYTDKEVPSFDEIQKCLVDIGDKPSNFIGSKQWIGSTEVSFVLDTLLEVSCKIVYVSSGTEMAYQGPELMRHFEVYGTPIMIGGGQLAHTILGVDYDQNTDNLKFLILDPHYTGAEDIKTIVNKGWCGWKGVEFWNKSSYYNMCLPMVPREI